MNQSMNTLRDTPKTAIVRPVCHHAEDLWRDPHGMQTKNERLLSRKFLTEAELNTKSSKRDTKHGLQNLINYPYHFVFFRVWKKTESQIKNKNNIRMLDQNCLSWPLSFQDQDSSGSSSSDLDDGPCVNCLGNPSVQRKATSTFSFSSVSRGLRCFGDNIHGVVIRFIFFTFSLSQETKQFQFSPLVRGKSLVSRLSSLVSRITRPLCLLHSRHEKSLWARTRFL